MRRVACALAVLLVCAVAPLDVRGAQQPRAATEVPCTTLRSALHGVVLLGARLPAAGGPPCALMQEYRDWLARSDELAVPRRARTARFSGREWDFGAGAVRVGAPTYFVLVRGDSLGAAAAGRPRRLYLSAFAAGPDEPPTRLGSWYVLVDPDSLGPRLFRSPVTDRRLHQVLEDRGSVVHAVGGVGIDAAQVRAQLAAARALRAALGFDDPLPAARYVVGPPRDSTLAMLGIVEMPRPLFAMTVFPPLVVFGPLSSSGGLDAHELAHVATFGRRDVVPAAVHEAFAMHHGGAHGRPFAEAFCASPTIRALDTLSPAQLDSALTGRWWNDPRADIAGFALGHAMGWFLGARGDSAWVFADGEPGRDADAIAFLAGRIGLGRDEAMDGIARSFGARRAACPAPAGTRPAARPTPPSAAAGVPAPASP